LLAQYTQILFWIIPTFRLAVGIAILLSLICGYLLGSVPFGLFAGRLHGVDVREHGSKNIGATNVWRVCGRKYGLPVFFLDAAKGAAAVWIGNAMAVHWGGDVAWCMVIGAMACVLGHSFPVWLKFKGGKGVATSLGAIIGFIELQRRAQILYQRDFNPMEALFLVALVYFVLNYLLGLSSRFVERRR